MNEDSVDKKLAKEVNLLKEILQQTEKKNKYLNDENNRLKDEILLIKSKINQQIVDIKSQYEDKLKRQLDELLRERGEKSSKEEWEKIIDEMAHSINSDVYVAVSYLSLLSSNPNANIALNHTKQIRDLINLIMFYLKRKEIVFTGEKQEISIEDYAKTQINTIKNSLSTLRLSADSHEDALKKIEIPIECAGDTTIKVPVELKDAISLILKDLLRNAFKNTSEENPEISMKITGEEKFIQVTIKNNKAISSDFSNWFNGVIDNEPKISKSSKVGLRVILKWTKLLGITANLTANKLEDVTIAKLLFPREIKYEG